MLEGTKHEKAVLVVLAYIIGLTSGFIGFGINDYYQGNTEHKIMISEGEMMEYSNSDLNAETETVLGMSDMASYNLPTENPPETTAGGSVVYEDGQLTAVTENGEVVLSVHVDQLGDAIPDILAAQGHHIEPPVYLVSPEGRYVYFCEQHLGSDDCTNFLFDTESVSIQYVQVNSQAYVSPVSQAASAYWAVDGLHIGEFISESLQSPWKLVEKGE